MTPAASRFFDRHTVRRALAAAGALPPDGGALRLDRAWPLAGGGACALWTDGERRGLWPVLRAAREKERRELARAVREGRAVALPALAACALLFPDDPLLPQLAGLLGQGAREGSAPGGGGPELLSYKPLRRCVVRLGTGRAARYVKLVRRRAVEELARRYRLLDRARGLDFAAPEEVRVADGAFVWRPAAGEPLTARLEKGSGEAPLAAAGGSLAALHASSVRLPGRHGREREIGTLRPWVELAASAVPRRAGRMTDLLARLERDKAALSPGRALPAHRDFHDGQVLVHGERTVLLDFDTASMAEPELDVGNFLAHLDLRGLGAPDSAATALAFLEGYRAAGGPALDPARLGWYRAAACLRIAAVHLLRDESRRLAAGLLARRSRRRDPHNDSTRRMEVIG